MPYILTAVRKGMEEYAGFGEFASSLEQRSGSSLVYKSTGISYKDWERAMIYGSGEMTDFRIYRTEDPVDDNGFFRKNRYATLEEIDKLDVVTWFVGKKKLPQVETFPEKGSVEDMIHRYDALRRIDGRSILAEKMVSDEQFEAGLSRN